MKYCIVILELVETPSLCDIYWDPLNSLRELPFNSPLTLLHCVFFYCSYSDLSSLLLAALLYAT